MAFSLGEDNDQGMTEMNLIPLIDIMLVLMIIFLVTATVANPSVPLTLPKMTDVLQEPPPKPLEIQINAGNEIFVNGQPVTLDQLAQRFHEGSQAAQKPTVMLKADKESKYDTVAQVMGRASAAGLADISFVSEN